MLYILKTDNAILELILLIQVASLLTAARKEGVEKEDRDARNDKDRVLQNVDDQVHI